MKSTNATTKSLPSASTSKHGRKSKERDKRKNSEVSNHGNNTTDKNSTSKDSTSRNYAGISAESIAIYAEQENIEHLSEEVCDMLAEDTNYKIRYVIQAALIKARLGGRNFVSGDDVEQTFADLNVDKVYGAPSNPIWVPFTDQNLYYLDDASVNLFDITRQTSTFVQPGYTQLAKKWYPEPNTALKNYFQSMCLSLVDKDAELRKFALKDLSDNPYVGPIVEWFYRFGYFLLTKDITYDCLTLYALDLIEVLEYSSVTRVNVSEKQLKLLVRLLLQRLLKTVTAADVLKPMCSLLTLLCRRAPLEDLVYTKIQQKVPQVFLESALPVITVINCLGYRAIKEIFIPNMTYFLNRINEQPAETELSYAVLGSYNLICLYGLETFEIYSLFEETFGESLVIFWKPKNIQTEITEKMEINVVNVRKRLIFTRRKVPRQNQKYSLGSDDVFERETPRPILKKKLDSHLRYFNNYRSTNVVIGKTGLLLPELAVGEKKTTCYDHGLSFNL